MIKLYTQSGCPMCDIVKENLKHSHIEYELITNTDVMMSKGITKVPVIEQESGEQLDGKAAHSF